MERKSNIFWGAALVVLGFLLLGTNLDWFKLDWSFHIIAQFWPIMLILAGVAAFFNSQKSIYNATSALLIAFAIPLGIYTCVDDEDRTTEEVGIGIDNFGEDNETSETDTSTNERIKQYFVLEMTPQMSEASLKLKGGIAEFSLQESPKYLFEATTLLGFKNGYTLEEENTNGMKTIEFSMKNKKGDNFGINLDHENKIDNDVLLKLNTTPVWNIDMGIGAGKVDFDLSDYKIKQLDIQTGAASIDIKLGSKQDRTNVDIESGVASVTIKIPESVGCEIRMDGALNAKDFDNFEKIKDGLWQTQDFDKATKKIYMNVDSGLSSLKIDRY